MNKEKFKAFFALFIATFFWGSAYIFVKQLLNNVSPYMILALRFCFAAIILIIIYNKYKNGGNCERYIYEFQLYKPPFRGSR